MSPDDTPRLQISFAPGVKITYDRGPIKFVLRDCFEMAVAVGAGFTFGVLAVVCIAAVTSKLLALVAA